MMNRRENLAALGALSLMMTGGLNAAPGKRTAFSWKSLINRAQALSRRQWQAVPPRTTAEHIDYDAVGQISYRPEKTLWGSPDSKSGVRFFPLSRYARVPITVYVIENGYAAPFEYSPELFEAGNPQVAALLRESEGFAGFRAMNQGGVGDWLAFQGASYFRTAGTLNQYGLSARGLAINTSTPGVTEEFPSFTHFWLEHGGDDSLIVYALLDGPSITGAYRFVNKKGANAITQDVTLALFPRKDIAQLGIAPLTSMFWYSEGNREMAQDWRPEIHDSDGLAIFTGSGERLWRPLINPARAQTNSFMDAHPQGFGLLQRDRTFDHYQDDGVFYEKRPSLWVEPQGDWGKGSVTLFEIPTNREVDDNIVAFWSPASPVRGGSRLDYAYRLNWISDEPQPIDVARAVNVWTGTAGRPGHEPLQDARKLVIDFAADGIENYANPTPMLDIGRGKLIEAHCRRVAGMTGRLRLTADIARANDDSTDIRAFVKAGDRTLTETVLYQLHWTGR